MGNSKIFSEDRIRKICDLFHKLKMSVDNEEEYCKLIEAERFIIEKRQMPELLYSNLSESFKKYGIHESSFKELLEDLLL